MYPDIRRESPPAWTGILDIGRAMDISMDVNAHLFFFIFNILFVVSSLTNKGL